MPTAVHSSTAACSYTASSIMRGYTLKPPEMIMSFLRSTIEKLPAASMVPTSPVSRKPSTIAAAVSSGRFQ